MSAKRFPITEEDERIYHILKARKGGAVAQASLTAEERSRRNSKGMRTRMASMTPEEKATLAHRGGQAIRAKHPPDDPYWKRIGKLAAEAKKRKQKEKEARRQAEQKAQKEAGQEAARPGPAAGTENESAAVSAAADSP